MSPEEWVSKTPKQRELIAKRVIDINRKENQDIAITKKLSVSVEETSN